MDNNPIASPAFADSEDSRDGTLVMPDAKFWSAHARWKALANACNVDDNGSDEAFDRNGAEVYEAFSAMWLTPVHSV